MRNAANGLAALAIAALACTWGCKGNVVTCGAGTQLQNGVCVASPQASAASASAATTASPAPAEFSETACEASCKRRATCVGLNADAPLITTRCKSECDDLAKENKATVQDLIACRTKETCDRISSCDEAFAKTVVQTARVPELTDPVLVTKTTVRPGDYGVGRSIDLSYKNNSGKDLDAIKFTYYCFNNFDEPEGSGKLIDQDKLAAGSSGSGTWKVYEDNCTKAKIAVVQVHFLDGSSWAP